jgi:PIN domain nuclease of toxin-antitoxin system
MTRGIIMNNHVSKSQFKAKALELFWQIETSGQPVVVTAAWEVAMLVNRGRLALSMDVSACLLSLKK